ncbi:hypothetical protein [Izhakiella capsodis]|nr:hypothetical protein [Izhakiella capsodis]
MLPSTSQPDERQGRQRRRSFCAADVRPVAEVGQGATRRAVGAVSA